MIPWKALRLKEVETQDRYQLVRYDFSNGQSPELAHVAIYTRETPQRMSVDSKEFVPEHEAVDRVLLPSMLWCNSYGVKIIVSIDRELKYDAPPKLKPVH